MNKTFNLYCDESCHIEHDGKPYMFLGSISCAYPQVKRHTWRIRDLKKKHNFYAEIKWSNVSNSKLKFYWELIDYFFDTDLKFRALGVKKSSVNYEAFHSSYDDFYYKMYYQLLNYKIDTLDHYNVYLDIKDTLSAVKVRKLTEILNVKLGTFRNIQNIRSNESLLLQLCDFIMGAISYENNDANHANEAKLAIIEKIRRHSSEKDLSHTNYNQKLNLFFIELR